MNLEEINRTIADHENLRVLRNKIELIDIFTREEFCAYVGIRHVNFERYVADVHREHREVSARLNLGSAMKTPPQEQVP